jgi:hypothetical protein
MQYFIARPDETIDEAIDTSEHRHILEEPNPAIRRKQCLYNPLNFCTLAVVGRFGHNTDRLAEQKIDSRIDTPCDIVLDNYFLSLKVTESRCENAYPSALLETRDTRWQADLLCLDVAPPGLTHLPIACPGTDAFSDGIGVIVPELAEMPLEVCRTLIDKPFDIIGFKVSIPENAKLESHIRVSFHPDILRIVILMGAVSIHGHLYKRTKLRPGEGFSVSPALLPQC